MLIPHLRKRGPPKIAYFYDLSTEIPANELPLFGCSFHSSASLIEADPVRQEGKPLLATHHFGGWIVESERADGRPAMKQRSNEKHKETNREID